MTIIGKFISAITDRFREIKINALGRYNPRTMSECLPYGVDTNPAGMGLAAVYADTVSVTAPGIVFGYVQKNQLALPGESRFFSTNSAGVEQTRIWLHDDGKIELGGTGAAGSNTNHAAQYEGLQTAFDQLKSDHDNLVDKFNTHTHATAGTGTPSPAIPIPPLTWVLPVPDSTADITPAKLNNILTE